MQQTWRQAVGGSYRPIAQSNFYSPTMIFTDARTTGISIAAAGGGAGHSHAVSSVGTIPPYYALAFIQKIS